MPGQALQLLGKEFGGSRGGWSKGHKDGKLLPWPRHRRSVFVCVCKSAHECVHECARMCMSVCMCTHVCMCAHMCACICVCMHVCVHVCSCVYVRVCSHVYARVCARVRVHVSAGGGSSSAQTPPGVRAAPRLAARATPCATGRKPILSPPETKLFSVVFSYDF